MGNSISVLRIFVVSSFVYLNKETRQISSIDPSFSLKGNFVQIAKLKKEAFASISNNPIKETSLLKLQQDKTKNGSWIICRLDRNT